MTSTKLSLADRIEALEKKLARLDKKEEPSNKMSPHKSKLFEQMGVAFVFYLMSQNLSKNPTCQDFDSFIEMMYSELENKIDRSQITPEFRRRFAEVCSNMTLSMMQGAINEAGIKG